jgi:signal transduction histidine kinase
VAVFLFILYNGSMGKVKRPKISEVVSIIAHQLKNPISIFKNYLEVLISEELGPLNQKQKEYLSDILENVKNLDKTANHLLDAYLIEEKKYKLKKEKFSLGKIVKEVIEDFSAWALAANCQIFFKEEKNLPNVVSDPFKIRQVIENLISNSIKYKNPGPQKIEISLKRKGKFVLFSCKDEGIGIPKSDFKKVFKKFYRSEKAMELDPTGSGLGLFINKAIIKLSKGRIWFKKNKGPGMTFYFTLPISNGK